MIDLGPRLVTKVMLAMAALTAPAAVAAVHATVRAPSAIACAAAIGFVVEVLAYVALAYAASTHARMVARAFVLVAGVLGALLSALAPNIAPAAALASLTSLSLCLPYTTQRALGVWAALAASTAATCVALGLLRPLGDVSVNLAAPFALLPGVGVVFVQLALLLAHRSSSAALEQRAADRANALRAAVDEAVSASDAKADFLATMSHEIRTPMNAVIGMTSLLLETPLSKEQSEYAVTIRRSGEHLLTVLNDILDFSKIEAGMLTLEFVSFDVQQLVEESLDFVRSEATTKGLKLACSVAEGTPRRATSDPTRIRQILANLLSNAVKFTTEGEVVVEVSWKAYEDPTLGELVFAVRDTGLGIPEDKLDRLFKSFSQVDATTSRRFGGTGLGLVIVKNLADLMGGNTWVASELGKGSTFSFTVGARIEPDPPPEAAAAARSEAAKPRPVELDATFAARHPLDILIAEDNIVNQRVVGAMLGRCGYKADIVANGDDAITKTQNEQYDLVLMDIQMPGTDGLAATRVIRERERGAPSDRPLWIVALTANATQEDRRLCMSAGMDDYLSKPVTPRTLIAALTRAVHRTPPDPDGTAETAPSP